MKGICLFLFLLSLNLAYAQKEIQVGVNIPPIIAKTLEVTSTFTTHPGYSINLNAGSTFGTSLSGPWLYDIYDGVGDRKTKGVFLKGGGRLFPFNMTGKKRRGNFYVGGFLILSHYNQEAMQKDLSDLNNDYPKETPISAKGTVFAKAFTMGFTHHLNSRLELDWGFQKSFGIKRSDYLGYPDRDYQPGVGTRSMNEWYSKYVQGVLSLRYRFGGTR